jgi:hypothetical protein
LSKKEIYGPTKFVDSTWRTKTNEELYNLIEHENIIQIIKSQRLRWLCHVERMPEQRDVKTIKLIASRPVGHPRIRWMDNVMKDIQAMKIFNWQR